MDQSTVVVRLEQSSAVFGDYTNQLAQRMRFPPYEIANKTRILDISTFKNVRVNRLCYIVYLKSVKDNVIIESGGQFV